jgi:L-asparaginase II
MFAADCVPLVEVTRGEIVESIHFGAYVVVNHAGKVITSAGNPALMTYPRSSMKPLQALSLIEQEGASAYHFSTREVAIMCASHSGTDLHRDVLTVLQKKIGIQETDLSCGVHWPVDKATREAMRRSGETPTQNRHNCSGKHTGMLAHVLLRGASKDDYLNPQHPVQAAIRDVLAEMVGLAPDDMPIGIDGCSAPVYGIPLRNMALGIAKMADPAALEPHRAQACRLITSAMMQEPVMVAGPGKFDTDLMKAAGGKVFSKGGAEGYQVIGVLPGAAGIDSPGLGIAIKISDGDRQGRARSLVTLVLLEILGVLGQEALAALSDYGRVAVKNWRKLLVGEVRPAFKVEKR